MLKKLIKNELFTPILLICMAILALILKNTNLNYFYDFFTNYKAGVIFGNLTLIKPMVLWGNNGLMAIFFFWVGLEVKKEIMQGSLRDIKVAILPAIGGVIVPALIYYAFNNSNELLAKGFATATDIAFALGVVLLLGNKVSKELKIFLLSLAIFDDCSNNYNCNFLYKRPIVA